MKSFHMPPAAIAILFAMLGMGFICILVWLPIACIQLAWNSIVPGISALPPISMWQAGLLYIAGATMLYLSGIIQVEFRAENIE